MLCHALTYPVTKVSIVLKSALPIESFMSLARNMEECVKLFGLAWFHKLTVLMRLLRLGGLMPHFLTSVCVSCLIHSTR